MVCRFVSIHVVYVFLICSFQNPCHHILNKAVGVSQPVKSCPGLTPQLEAPHGTTFQVLEGSTNWMLPTESL